VKARVLVTAAGGALAPLNIKLLQASTRHQVHVHAVDAGANATGRHFADAFSQVPFGTDPGFVDAMIDIVERDGITIVLPWSDEEAVALAAARDRVERAGALLACAPTEALAIMNDKAATFRMLEAHGLGAPAWVLAETEAALALAIARFAADGGEFVLKPLISRGNRGILVIRTDVSGQVSYMGSRELHMDMATFEASHRAGLAEALPVIVMERLGEPVFDIDLLAHRGAILRHAPRRRINPAGVPFTGSVLAPHDGLHALAVGIAQALDLSWLYDIDVMTDRAGQLRVIEINPRPSGSVAASILAGIPFYDDLISIAGGETLAQQGPLPDVTIVPYLDCQIVKPSDRP
jgi:carbamoylphosphate synthase large subunit